jgi:intein-encoded DNA endonuclease-like protein
LPIIKCQYCGREVYKDRQQKFCSKECAVKFKRETTQEIDFLTSPKVDTELKYYLIGLIWGDGCLVQQKNKSPHIVLALKDKELLEQIRLLLCPHRKLYINKKRKPHHSNSYVLVIRNYFTIKGLQELGLTHQKSKNISFPKIEEPFIIDFIRGYFDANGAIYYDVREEGYIYKYVKITTGSRDFALGLKEVLKKLGFNPVFFKDKRHMAYYIQLSRKQEVEQFGNLIYSNKQWYLKRKYQRFYEDIVQTGLEMTSR